MIDKEESRSKSRVGKRKRKRKQRAFSRQRSRQKIGKENGDTFREFEENVDERTIEAEKDVREG